MSSLKSSYLKPRKAASVLVTGMLMLANTLCLSANAGDATSSKGGNYSFLVAIDDYISPNINKLTGCKKDIQDVEKELVKFGFSNDPEHMKVLTDHAATKQAIIDGFKSQLIENAKKHPDAMFYFQYSGHGSRWRDPDGGDEDGFDETIVPADSRTPDHFDLTDKEIAPLVGELTKYTSNAILTFDCCHSGDITRGGGNVRMLRDDDRPVPKNLSVPRKTRGLSAGDEFVPRSDRFIAFSACLPTEVAQETQETNDADHNGLMTRNLIESLNKAKPTTTYRQLIDLISQNMAPQGQHPQIVGDLDRVVFGDSSKHADPSVKVNNVSDNVVTIDGGSDLGITKDCVIAFYKDSALSLVGEKDLLARGVVTKVSPLTSEVTLPKDSKASADALKTAKATVASSSLNPTAQRIILETPNKSEFKSKASEDLVSNFEKAVGRYPQDMTIVRRETNPFGKRGLDADVIVATDTFKKFANGRTYKDAPADDKQVYFLTNSAGAPLFSFFVTPDDPEAGQKIANAIERKSRQDYIHGLNNSLSPLSKALKLKFIRVSGYRDTAKNDPIEEIRPEDQLGSPDLKLNDRFRLEVKNTSDTPLYINVLTTGTSGSIKILYRSTTKALEKDAVMKTPVLKLSPPAGVVGLKVIATTRPADFSLLEQSSVTRDTEAGSVPSGNSSLQRLITRGVTTRDAEIEGAAQDTTNSDDWTTATQDFVVRDPDQEKSKKM
ncbi:MAG TPA: caspase family protein [Drouetiella sp.]